ncbi:helix-turn-helix domain-containing protein [Nocardioides sp. CCNWLW239]|uniref:IclR family transcriptional regulator n=1 Tax=Nocardioides sp. CCNWLW239 TaxID=3128902 RepID=UPI0030178DA1
MDETARPAAGSQTLARGLRTLEMVATARDGLSIQEVATRLDVHRSIASRMLATLAEFRLVTRSPDGRYRTGTGLTALADGIHTTLRAAAEPAMRQLAEELGATVSLLVAEGSEAVALAVMEPPGAAYVLSFRTGSRHPIGRGSAGIALLAAQPPLPGERASVTAARELGYAETFGEVEQGAYGVAVPLPPAEGVPPTCLNLITHRSEVAAGSAPKLVAAAAQIAAALQ